MTYIVSDGKHVIADKLLQASFGGSLTGRTPPTEDNRFVYNPTRRDTDFWFNDANKLVAVDGGMYQGEAIKVLGLSGSTRNLPDLLGALEQGVDFQDYLRVEANILPVEERRIFGDNTCIFITLENGESMKFYGDGKSIRHLRTKKFLHTGSGTDVVDSMRRIVNLPEGRQTKLTALEAFVVASSHCDTVSRAFDYYCIESGKFVRNQQLTDRQTLAILNGLQKRVNVEFIRSEKPYSNR